MNFGNHFFLIAVDAHGIILSNLCHLGKDYSEEVLECSMPS